MARDKRKRKPEPDPDRARSTLRLDSGEVTFVGVVKFEGAWVWGRQVKNGGLEAYPARRVLEVIQLPDATS
jgi:hypothetical protein